MNRILKSKWLKYSLIFLFFLVLCYLFPFFHDDWAWGSRYGIERLESHFEGYNGRWMGNFVVLLLTRSNLLKTITMAFSLTGILWLINNLTSKKNSVIYMSLLLLLATPYLIFREAIVWTSGFSNYTISTFFVLLAVYINKNLFIDENKNNFFKSFILLILGFITTLFVEHITLYVIALAIFANIYSYIKTKKINWGLVFYLIGIIAGTALMFSNSAYSNIQAGEDGYRSMETSNFIESSIKSYFTTIYKQLFFNNYLLNVILSIVAILNLSTYIKKNKFLNSKKYNNLIYLVTFILISYPLYSLITTFSGTNLLLKYTKYFNGLYSIVYYIAIFISILFVENKESKKKLIFALFSIAVLTAPLFVVTPIGGRCFFPMYVLWIWIVIEFLNNLNIENKLFDAVIMSGILTFMAYLLLIYGYIAKINIERINYINDNKDKKELVLPKLPYQKYMWNGDPVNEEFLRRFKLFYKIDEDVNIEFVTIKEWNKKK